MFSDALFTPAAAEPWLAHWALLAESRALRIQARQAIAKLRTSVDESRAARELISKERMK